MNADAQCPERDDTEFEQCMRPKGHEGKHAILIDLPDSGRRIAFRWSTDD